MHGEGLTETQRAERVIAYDELSYGFVRMAAEALRDAGVVAETVTTTEAWAGAATKTVSETAEGTTSPATVRPDDGGLHRLILERLHVSASAGALAAVGPKNNPFLTPLQNKLRKSPEFQSALHAFVKAEVCRALGVSRVAYQRRPTFRVHLVGGGRGGERGRIQNARVDDCLDRLAQIYDEE